MSLSVLSQISHTLAVKFKKKNNMTKNDRLTLFLHVVANFVFV